MHPSLRRDILDRLTGPDYRGVVKGDYVQRIECPECHKREAYAHADAPWMILCGRMDKCAARIHAKDQFPEFFDDWADRYAPKDGEMPRPNAVADGYLSDGRGFDLARIRGLYTQEYHRDERRNIGSPTVRFTLPGGATWERILHKPFRFGKQKAVFRGEYKGDAWQMATDAEIVQAGEVWIVEGIFDAIALAHHGIPALSAMSCYNYPAKALDRIAEAAHRARVERPTLVWALDSNRAGQNGAIKHAKRAAEDGWTCRAAQPPFGRDWNDLHQRHPHELGAEHIETYRYYGDLLLAASPTEKGRRMYIRREQRAFVFEHRLHLYWFQLDAGAFDKAVKAITGDTEDDERQLLDHERQQAVEQAAKVQCICTASPQVLYYQANEVTDESWYYFRIDSPSGEQVQNTFSGGQLSGASDFKKRLLSVSPGAMWTGSSQQLDTLLRDQMAHITTVKTIDFVGYSAEHGAYVLGDVAVARGRVFPMTSEDYFHLGRLRLKTLSRSVPLQINTKLDQMTTQWVADLITAWGTDGVVALAFWMGALFAEQIRDRHDSFPFFELVGEPGTGKSTLIEFLWKLVGRDDHEGFDPSKSTAAGRARNFAQVGNLPVVLIESDREKENGLKVKQFDWDELKTAFNGRSLRSRGVKNGGNDTYDPPFRGAIVISQNAPVQAGEAIQSRLVHITMHRGGQTRATQAASERIAQYDVEDVSGFVIKATTAEQRLLELVDARIKPYSDRLMDRDEIRVPRIGRNHGQLMALVDCLGPDGLALIDNATTAAARDRVEAMAVERQHAINADHPIVEEFWDAVEYLETLGDTPVVNHYGKAPLDGRIAINLKQFEHACALNRVEAPPAKELKRYLTASRSRKFVESNKSVASRITDKTTRCWIFQGPKSVDD